MLAKQKAIWSGNLLPLSSATVAAAAAATAAASIWQNKCKHHAEGHLLLARLLPNQLACFWLGSWPKVLFAARSIAQPFGSFAQSQSGSCSFAVSHRRRWSPRRAAIWPADRLDPLALFPFPSPDHSASEPASNKWPELRRRSGGRPAGEMFARLPSSICARPMRADNQPVAEHKDQDGPLVALLLDDKSRQMPADRSAPAPAAAAGRLAVSRGARAAVAATHHSN